MPPTSRNPITDPHPGDVIKLGTRLTVTVVAVGPDEVCCTAASRGSGVIVNLAPSWAEWRKCAKEMVVQHAAD